MHCMLLTDATSHVINFFGGPLLKIIYKKKIENSRILAALRDQRLYVIGTASTYLNLKIDNLFPI